MPTRLKNGETLLFIGDSITDCGRREPPHQPLGCGYVRLVADMLAVREPKKKVAVLNRGIGGNNIGDLRNRWHDDVLEIRPDWLSVKIGINDLNQTLCGYQDFQPHVFEQHYDFLLGETVRRLPGCRLLLIEPFFMSRDRTRDSYRARVLRVLPDYLDVVRRMSRKYKTRLVNTHALFQQQLKHHRLEVFSNEPVHPNSAGHLLIADAVYQTLSR